MSDDAHQDVTALLARSGEHAGARSELLEIVYRRLHEIARHHMQRERTGHTLQATALVHEAYVRLLGERDVSWQSRGAFFAAAAEAMRRILVDHARRRGSQKRGGAHARCATLADVADLAAKDPADVLALDDALRRLAEEDPRAARVVELRCFAGLDVDAAALTLGLSERTVLREWAFARARLYELLEDGV